MTKARRKITVRLGPGTIRLLDRFRKEKGWSRGRALREILTHEIRSGGIARALKKTERRAGK